MKKLLLQNKWFIIWTFVLGLAYLITRLINLTLLPIFTDEAIYIRWAQIGGNDVAWRFISLTDGKQPLFTWLMMVTLRIFDDPLFAGRLVSVGAGIGSLIGLMFLGWELFRSRRILAVAAVLYIFSPFALMYDRLALYDSLSTAFAVWSCYLAVRLVRNLKLDIALVLGLVLGFGMINKTSGFLSLYMMPFTILLFDWSKKQRFQRLLRLAYLICISGALSQMIYAVLRLSPFFHMISQKDSVFVYPITQVFYTWRFFIGNMRGLLDWFIHYLTIPVVAAMIPAFFVRKQQRIQIVFLSLWCILPFLALGYFGKVLYPRYILFMVIPLLLLTAITIDWFMTIWKRQYRLFALVVFILFFSVRASYYILFNPVHAPIPFADRGQLIDDWPAGGGVKEVNAFFAIESKKSPIAVFTEGTFGLLPYAIELYHGTNANIKITGFWPITNDFPEEMLESAKQKPTYIILNHSPFPPESWPIELIARYPKGKSTVVSLQLYKVISSLAAVKE